MLRGDHNEPATSWKGMEDRRSWYEAEVLIADLAGHRHTMRGAQVEEIEARMRAPALPAGSDYPRTPGERRNALPIGLSRRDGPRLSVGRPVPT